MIDVRSISRRFDALVALDAVSFRVEPGEIVALLGPNGAGKTTASRIIAGILAPSDGDVVVDGISVRRDPTAVRRRTGFVTDQPSLYDRMPLRAYLDFFCRLYDVADPPSRVTELASLLGLADRLDARLGTFSRGMKQKVAIARGLVHDPPVLLLDEPATALDPETGRMLRAFIVSLRARHRAILLCTHDLDEAQRIADRVVVVYRGRVVRAGTTEELRAAERPSYVVTFAGDAAAAHEALARIGLRPETVAANGHTALRFTPDDAPRVNPAALRALLDAGVGVLTLTREDRSLEDAYFSIVAQATQG
ncbi:MAG TPA: ABC transporter ATP-binding protein [Candidatus Limnocylindrales bacterium]|nr:ABC transporter ATP-binding protein [Candidatus Limnocylindrales bacterium]